MELLTFPSNDSRKHSQKANSHPGRNIGSWYAFFMSYFLIFKNVLFQSVLSSYTYRQGGRFDEVKFKTRLQCTNCSTCLKCFFARRVNNISLLVCPGLISADSQQNTHSYRAHHRPCPGGTAEHAVHMYQRLAFVAIKPLFVPPVINRDILKYFTWKFSSSD